MAELIIKDLCKAYTKNKKQVHAVRALNLICRDGEFIALLGPSGCGKSTTLRMIAGLENISSGDIMIGGKSVSRLHPSRRNVGLAFENYALYPPLTIYENIAFNLRARKIPDSQIKQEVSQIAELLHITELLPMKPSALSGGQKQRVNIARAIVRRPGVLLLDEPLSHLDGKMRQTMRTEIKRLHTEMKTTSIIVTHDQSEAMALADRIAIINEGVLQQYGTPLEVYNHPVNEFVAGFIGEPPMNLFHVKTVQSQDRLQFQIEDSELVFPVPDKYIQRVRASETYRLGIRPTDIYPVDGNSPCTLSARVSIFEHLGEENRIHIRIHEQLLSLITMQDTVYRPGDEIRLLFREDRMHLFDPQSGNRI
ncbi:ABC transporter ATP-binding protein [Paenibacillus thiaminolyticus]|uniref:ABC transporter ATP-binding protein n=1 Tax=Paenibacillus thiaminolyticus TaxID=49283 RepID=A0AAP9DY80_PANTH|nr:ABC transporter ATP-binding protein [Paenibacillus thiaminolyticus]MCY9537648.1 ABC transporter ATP-binding protein [Paenibacillus thiaminolyticus]MCY9601729.1 ABC transporter ATP-binding protein [Paenibacillus thiaminolyticus]MCY9607139.1 ABC transporter ATP-binding protein [Paenibacillus thiaminolyticus]MCY9614173.1 ABC transporter ATP-binding protein [Paenibacillus thiaminolyticus]MCY9619270.1 ABC transporter ATP-binding protein [Paenibacillus thiaminolyticus]